MKWLMMSVLLLTAACSHRAPSGTYHNLRPVIAPASIQAPAKDIYTAAEVQMLHRGGDDYEFAAAATPHYTGAEILAVVYCRASLEATKLGYQGWYPQMSFNQLSSLEGPRIAGAVVTFTRGPVPSDASDSEYKTQWCTK